MKFPIWVLPIEELNRGPAWNHGERITALREINM